MGILFRGFTYLVSAVAVKVISHGVDAAFFDTPVGGPTSFRKSVVDVNDITIKVVVLTVVFVQVAALLAFWKSPVFVSCEFFFIQAGDKLVGTFPTAPFTSFLVAVDLEPHQLIFGIGDGVVTIIHKTFPFSHTSNPIKLMISRYPNDYLASNPYIDLPIINQ